VSAPLSARSGKRSSIPRIAAHAPTDKAAATTAMLRSRRLLTRGSYQVEGA
jgi:hypothetical protein